MTKEKDLPAFPSLAPLDSWDDPYRGMNLRDYFAAKAMSLVMPPVLDEIRKRNISFNDVEKLKQVSAEACYSMADAMLKAREQ